MANCLYCKHFIKLKHAEGCAKYKKVLLTWEKTAAAMSLPRVNF